MDIDAEVPLVEFPADELLHIYLKVPQEVPRDVQAFRSFRGIRSHEGFEIRSLAAHILDECIEIPVGEQLVNDTQRIGELLRRLELGDRLFRKPQLLVDCLVLTADAGEQVVDRNTEEGCNPDKDVGGGLGVAVAVQADALLPGPHSLSQFLQCRSLSRLRMFLQQFPEDRGERTPGINRRLYRHVYTPLIYELLVHCLSCFVFIDLSFLLY